jgi:inorganic phosphate transporter, PiT family
VTVALLVVLGLSWRGIATSVTLAVIGGLAGAGLGLGLSPSWAILGVALAVAAVAPMVDGGLAFLLGRLAGRLPAWSRLPALVRLGHLGAFAGLSLAYAANDGQKIFAVIGVASAAVRGTTADPLPLPVLIAAAAMFATGAVVSLRRMARGSTFQLLAPRPWHLVSAQLAASAAIFGSAAAGIPVSMTQSAAARMVGAGASHGLGRVRWQHALPVMSSWLATLPASFLLGIVAGLLLRTAV